MPVEFTCPTCEGTLQAADGPAGRLVRCGGCMAVLKVPDVPPLPPEPAPPPPYLPAPEPPDGDDDAESAAARGVRFWSRVILAAVVVGILGCCGLASVILPDPEWQTYDSAKGGGFRVELPAPPRDNMAGRVRAAQGQTVEGTNLRTRAESYTITHWVITPTKKRAETKTDEQWLDDQVKVLTSDPEIKSVTRTKPVEVSGFPGREFEYRFKNGGTFTGLVVVADSRAYVLLAGGRFTRPDSPNVRRFLDSFEITDPKLLAVVKQRADEKQAVTLLIRAVGKAILKFRRGL